MTANIEFERFHRDHATPEDVMAYFSGLGPDPSPDDIASAFQAGGYNITLSDLDNVAKEYQVDSNVPGASLSEIDLEMIVGGGPAYILTPELSAKKDAIWKKYGDNPAMAELFVARHVLSHAKRCS